MSLLNLAGHLILVYGNLNVLIPRLYKKRKFILYALFLIGLLVATTLFRYFVGWESVQILGWGVEFFYRPNLIGGFFFGGLWVLLLSVPLGLIDNYYRRQELEQELKTQQLEAELRFLKAQVNPHFLFNALNNIYSLSFTNSEKTPEMILKLSDMMSYMLYDCKEEQVPLTSEIQYLRNFIDLQQLKKDGEYQIDFEVKGDPEGMKIVPMLFIPFFENAFKHGNLDELSEGWLKAQMEITPGRRIRFEIQNSRDPNKPNEKKGGVGLKNIRDRLSLLFPEKHQLKVTSGQNTFRIQMEIEAI